MLARKRTQRTGFTLIELLIVIGIIAVLVGLLMSALFVTLETRARTQTREDISELEKALVEFKAEYGIFPPSKVLLSPNESDYATPIGQRSLRYLLKIWPKLDMSKDEWKKTVGATPEVLEGDQCLVFFLGGLPLVTPQGNDTQGFAAGDVSTPLRTGGERKKFYQFKSERLIKRGSSQYFSYKDAYDTGQPYVYFSSGFRDNGYNADDCSTLNVDPYYKSTTPVKKYYNPATFQIISAGKDGLFGGRNIGVYLANEGTILKDVRDNQANFHNNVLGAGE